MQLPGTDKKSIFLKKPKLLYIGIYKPNAGWLRSIHSHDFCEVMFVKAGDGLFRVNDTSYPVKKGDLITCNPGVNHAEYVSDSSERDLMFLGITRIRIEGYPENCLLKNEPFKIVSTGPFYEQIKQYFEQLLVENEMKPAYFSVISESLLTIIISYVLRLTSDNTDELFESKKTYTEVKEFFDRNYTTIDTIDNVCRSLYINKFYLTHLFKDTLGIPPLKYLIQKRVSLAKRLLATTSDPISDVAKACGYVDIAYFCRVFKRVEGVTPLAYRKSSRPRDDQPEQISPANCEDKEDQS